MTDVKLPRVSITYCTQCKWMLRAAYFGQELLSTFGTTIGEISLIPATGGIFTVNLTYKPSEVAGAKEDASAEVQSVLLWDRKAEGGFPETKVLKQRVRDHLEPSRNLGHSDVHGKHGKKSTGIALDQPQTVAETEPVGENNLEASNIKRNADGTICEDCR
ncbi:Selenoprotein Rdx type [Macrophomina phaseolina MS6]|uniref:Selenoprotein Rdx type n=2 Tax=Macrophomina phaseolina TaxID=35725 RepID=K2RU40_MACPH|nr:Selenoprotein Rdx type [Macrophomina phaseolina MS6]KAH7065356.1 seleno protein W family protein [Macrophomina phaseolina]